MVVNKIMSSVFQDVSFWTLIAVLGLYLIQFYKWLWAKLKVMEVKRAENRAKRAEERRKNKLSTNISSDDATKLMKLLQAMKEQENEKE
jgi:hypothetical protein